MSEQVFPDGFPSASMAEPVTLALVGGDGRFNQEQSMMRLNLMIVLGERGGNVERAVESLRQDFAAGHLQFDTGRPCLDSCSCGDDDRMLWCRNRRIVSALQAE